MEILYLVLAMIVVGLIVGHIAGLIWKDEFNNYSAAIIGAGAAAATLSPPLNSMASP